MIYPECQVTWSSSLVSLEALLLERLMKYKQEQGVGEGFESWALKERCWIVLFVYISAAGVFAQLHTACYVSSSSWLNFFCLIQVVLTKTLSAKSVTALDVDWFACQLLTRMFVCPYPCVFVLCWERVGGGNKFRTLAPDWRQWPFILHCPTYQSAALCFSQPAGLKHSPPNTGQSNREEHVHQQGPLLWGKRPHLYAFMQTYLSMCR